VVSSISKSWVVHGDGRPLAQRWETVSAQLVRLGGIVSGPMTESVLADMQAEVERLKKPQVWDERLNGAKIDLDIAISEHQQLLAKVAFEQRAVSRLAESDEFRIIGTITAKMLRAPEPTQSVVSRIAPKAPRQSQLALPGTIYKPDFRDDVDAWRAATRFMQIENQKLTDLYQDMIKAQQHTTLPRGDQAKILVLAQQQRIDALEARLHDLEQRLSTSATTRKRAS
jgi:hypothetical protein